jgi:hypothetical protein
MGALSLGSVASHIFLIQDLHASRAFRINSPMWSVATEWWIYFAFGLIVIELEMTVIRAVKTNAHSALLLERSGGRA